MNKKLTLEEIQTAIEKLPPRPPTVLAAFRGADEIFVMPAEEFDRITCPLWSARDLVVDPSTRPGGASTAPKPQGEPGND